MRHRAPGKAIVTLAIGSSIAIGASLLTAATPASAAQNSAAVYTVVQEGLTEADGAALAKAYGIENALRDNGVFGYVDTSFAQAPLVVVGQGRDESGRATVSQALDDAALAALKPITDADAVGRAGRLIKLASRSPDLKASTSVSHTTLTLTDTTDRVTAVHPLDTAVSVSLSLNGLPVTGQGAKLRITFTPDGRVSQLAYALRTVERAGTVSIISPAEAATSCAALYPAGTRQRTPSLGYQFPALGANDANGEGPVSSIFPQYTCNPIAESGTLAHRLLPAVAGSAPAGTLVADRSGNAVKAQVNAFGGTAPYTYRWSSSSSTLLGDAHSAGVVYHRSPRENVGDESVTVEITDANGLAATATVELNQDGSVSAGTTPGGGGFGELSVGPDDVGIEQTVDEWQCAQDSATGFKNVMASHGVGTQFDWRGVNAFEWDFKDPSLGGGDSTYVDDVDAVWYTGHGWSGGFTFKTNVTDTSIVPADARWGNRDLEWLQLESCQVLADTDALDDVEDYFSRWVPAFAGLHILNGFHTNAYCVEGGTGGTFAEYLFPYSSRWWPSRPALRVESAWASMAIDKEPVGVVYRSMGLIGPAAATNFGDYFWGQGPTGPDIDPSSSVGRWSVTGTV